MGALINRDGTGQKELMDLVFRDLAAVHGVTVEWLQKFYTPGDYFAWDWLRDPLTMGPSSSPVTVLALLNGCLGGYAFFGPGVYGDEDIYSQMLLPAANGKLFFAGEAASACHAYVNPLPIPSTEFPIQTLSTAGSLALWTAHGVPSTSTSTSMRKTYPRAL